jgi:hypothetical protein
MLHQPDRLVESGDGRQSHRRDKGVPAQARRRSTAANPAPEHHLICDGNGTPIYVLTSGANVPDISRALDLLDGYPPIAGRPGRPRCPLTKAAHSSPACRLARRCRRSAVVDPPTVVSTCRRGKPE